MDCCDESWTEVKGRKIKGKVTPPQLPKPKGFTLSDFISPSSFEELDKDDQDDNAKAKTKRTTTTTTTRAPPPQNDHETYEGESNFDEHPRLQGVWEGVAPSH